MATITISDWKPLTSGSLRGFVTISMPSGMIVREVAVYVTNGKAWAKPPSKPMIDRNGCVMLDAGGKRRYSPLFEFASTEIRTRWSSAVIAALLAAHPEALRDE